MRSMVNGYFSVGQAVGRQTVPRWPAFEVLDVALADGELGPQRFVAAAATVNSSSPCFLGGVALVHQIAGEHDAVERARTTPRSI